MPSSGFDLVSGGLLWPLWLSKACLRVSARTGYQSDSSSVALTESA